MEKARSITMENVDKEVFFYKYCPTCKHINVSPDEDPCNECLTNGKNINSHKPVNWEAV